MKISLNKSQKLLLSDFFNNVAVAAFIALFLAPDLSPNFNSLTAFKYIANIVVDLVIALSFRKD